MQNDKIAAYFGFAARARNLQTGYNTCLMLIAKRKAKLVIVAEDASEGTRKKITEKCRSCGIKCRIYGSGSELSHITGKVEKKVFAITDVNLARAIDETIDHKRSEGDI